MDETGPSHLTVFMEGLVRLVPISYRPVNVVKQGGERWERTSNNYHPIFISFVDNYLKSSPFHLLPMINRSIVAPS